MSKKIEVHGFEGQWQIVADIKTTDQPRFLAEHLQSGKLLVVVILNGKYNRVAGPFTAGEAFQGAVDILSGRTPLGSVTTAMQSIAAGLLRLIAEQDFTPTTKTKEPIKH